jgi:hypothetical protein
VDIDSEGGEEDGRACMRAVAKKNEFVSESIWESLRVPDLPRGRKIWDAEHGDGRLSVIDEGG